MIEILIIDDDLFVITSLKYALERNIINVSIVMDAEEALDLCAEKNYDLIVLDINLPHQDGIEFANNLRRIGQQTPIIPISADINNKDAEDKLAFGTYFASDLINKPIEIEDINKIISSLSSF